MSIGKVTKSVPWIPKSTVVTTIPTCKVREPVQLDIHHPQFDSIPAIDWEDADYPAEQELRFD